METEVDSEETLLRQKQILKTLEKSKFNPTPVAEYICRATNCRNLTQLANRPNGAFGYCPDAWSLMRKRTVGIETGSVRTAEGAKEFEFTMDCKNREQETVSCFLTPSETCRFLDAPSIPDTEAWTNPVTGVPRAGDLDRVCVTSCTARHQWSSLPINIDTRLNFYHTGVNRLQQLEQQDAMWQAGGGTKGAYMTIAATSVDGEAIDRTPLASLHFGPTNDAFTRTMALIDESNIENGIIEIPFEVCKAAGLPVHTGTPKPSQLTIESLLERMELNDADPLARIEGERRIVDTFERNWEERTKDLEHIKSFFAIPIMHVLAWVFHSEDYSSQHKIRAEMLRFKRGTDEPVLLYYLVADVYYRQMKRDFLDTDIGWMGKVDMRPLNSIAIDFVPAAQRERYPTIPKEVQRVRGIVALRSYITYWVPPVNLTKAEISTLAPTLAPGLTGSQEWVGIGEEQQLAIDRHIKGQEE